jgi:LPS-assembly lipoprotein
MWWCKRNAAGGRLAPAWGRVARLAVVLAAAGLTAGCFQPLYGTQPSAAIESVRDKLAQIDVPVIPAAKGQSVARVAVELRNSLQYGLNGAAGANAPTYTLKVFPAVTTLSVIVDVTSGRPDAQVASIIASYQLIEIATGKTVLSDSTFAHVDYDIPGAAQRFAKQRAQRDAEDRATEVVSETIKNRLASYFVAGT